MHLYSLCQTWLNLKTHTVSETEVVSGGGGGERMVFLVPSPDTPPPLPFVQQPHTAPPPRTCCSLERAVMHAGPGRASFEQGGGEGGRGFWTQNLVYQKWPDQIFPIVNFVFSHYRGGGGFRPGTISPGDNFARGQFRHP